MARLSQARASAFDTLQAERESDERWEIQQRGGIAPHRDGTPNTAVASVRVGSGWAYRCRCSCGFEGSTVTAADYRIARDEMVAHRRTHR